MVGQTVGKYRIVSRLGRGGMGTVYKAVDETLDREVAIKSLNTDLGDTDLLKRFRAEAIALARLNHPNIATIFELTEHEGQLLMVMEFVRGETFDRVSQREGRMPVERAAQLCAQVLDALEHAHRAGIVHRDLKPANLMLTESGLVKVMDFGLARMAGTEHLTNDGYMVGTPAYMSPEQVLGREIDGRADLYAMGVVLYRLLTSQLPFKAESGIAMVQHQLNDPPTPVRQLRSELPDACEQIIGRALAKLAGDRFQTAEEFRSALGKLDAGVGPAPASRILPAAAAAAAMADAEPTLPPTPTPGMVPGMSPPTVVLPRSPAPAPAPALPGQAAKTVPITQASLAAALSEPTSDAASRPPAAAAARPPTSRGVSLAAVAAAAAVLVVSASGVFLWRAHRTASAVGPAASGASAPATPGTSSAGVAPASASASPVPAPAADPAPPPAPPVVVPAPSSPSGGASAAPGVARHPVAAPAARSAAVGTSTPSAAPSAAASAPAAEKAALPTVTFANVKLLIVDDRKSRDRDASLRLGADRLDVLGGDETIESVAYQEVIGLYHSHSREPRWETAEGTSVPVAKTSGRFAFLKGTPDWLTVRTSRVFIPLRVRDDDLSRLTTELEHRTGARVVRIK